MQAHRCPCKSGGDTAGSCPRGSAKKGRFSVKVWGWAALRSGFKGGLGAGVQGPCQHSWGQGVHS